MRGFAETIFKCCCNISAVGWREWYEDVVEVHGVERAQTVEECAGERGGLA